MTKIIDDFLRPFSLAQIATLHTLAMEMEAYGLTPADVIDLCVLKMEEARKPQPAAGKPKAKQINRNRRNPRLSNVRCPECQAFCEIAPVNISKCTNIGGSWKSSIVCSNKDCRFTELSEKPPEELRK